MYIKLARLNYLNSLNENVQSLNIKCFAFHVLDYLLLIKKKQLCEYPLNVLIP